MKKDGQIATIVKLAEEFKERAQHSPGDHGRRDPVKPDERKAIHTAYDQLQWSYAKIADVFDRDPRTARRSVQSVQRERRAKREAQSTPLPAMGEHENTLRALVRHLVHELGDLTVPYMPSIPERSLIPVGEHIAVTSTPIENEPVFQALMKHLENTDIPGLWKDAEIARLDYFRATGRHSVSSSDADFVRRATERVEALRAQSDQVWQRYDELTFSLRQKLKELLLWDKIPGECHQCPRK